MALTRDDIADLDILDAIELESDGSSSYLFRSESIGTVTSGTKQVSIPAGLLLAADNGIGPGDIVVITGNAAAGTYTVDQVIDQQTFSVVESIPDAAGGSVDFIHAAGAGRIGVDTTGFASSSATTLSALLEDLDAAASSGGVPPTIVGQVPFSMDGVTFTPQLPLTAPFGWLISDQGLHLVVG